MSPPDAGPARLAGDAHDPARGLHQRVVSGVFGERAAAAEGADRAVAEPAVEGAQIGRTEAEPLCATRAKALDAHGRALRQAQQRIPPCRCGEVESERALAGAGREEHHAPAGGEWRPPGARLVAVARMLDLDNVGAARICVQYGPAGELVRSSTRMPSSG